MSAELGNHDPTTAQDEHEDLDNNASAENRGVKRQRTSTAAAPDDDDDDDDKPGRERRKIEIKFIQDKSRRHITFSKRKAGIMKKVRGCCRGRGRCCCDCVPSRRGSQRDAPSSRDMRLGLPTH